MPGPPQHVLHLTGEQDGLTLAAALKRLMPDATWSRVKKLIAGRRVQVNGNLCLDEGRQVAAGDVLHLWDHALAQPATAEDVKLVYVDEHLVVVNKPAGVTTLRHRAETDLPQRRKQLQPTLDELVPRLLARHFGLAAGTSPTHQRGRTRQPRTATTGRGFDRRLAIFPVHRLDRDTSGLMLFARTREAEQKLIRMFARHEVQRAYVAVAHGRIDGLRTFESWLVRDRGDGLRGSSPAGSAAEDAQRAVTHIRPLEQHGDYTVVECRLETGRTHQIRIHLAEAGHPLCGEKTYTHQPGQPPHADDSRAPRHALHAAELALRHPVSGQPLRFRAPIPLELKQWLLKLRGTK